jgi:hypothetical protein
LILLDMIVFIKNQDLLTLTSLSAFIVLAVERSLTILSTWTIR